MPLEITPDGVLALQQRFLNLFTQWPDALAMTLARIDVELENRLREATPVGTGRTDGHLADSYTSDTTLAGVAATTTISTTQPDKLTWVTQGTGLWGPTGSRIVPRVARALFWPEAPHPVASVAGQPPNDFVSPVLAEADGIVGEQLQVLADWLMSSGSL